MTVRVIASAFLTIVLAAAPAAAQTVTTPSPSPPPVLTTTPSAPTSTPTTTPSAYDTLSPGNRKIARALFDAQQTQTTTGTGTSGTGTTGPTSKTLTLDQIAAMKQSGQGWGEVFKQMKANGLVTEKNLGQVVSRYNHLHHVSSGKTTTAANRATDVRDDARGKSRVDGDQDRGGHGAGHGGDGSSQAAISHGNGNGNGHSSWSGGGGNSSHGGGMGRSK